MAIVDNKKLRFVKKGFQTISDAKAYATNGRVVFDATHKVVCVDQQVYGGSTYKGTAMNHDQLVAFLKDTNNMPGYMYSIGFADEDNVTGGNWVNHSVDPATYQGGTYAGGAHPTQTQGAVVDNGAEATGEYNSSYGVEQPAKDTNKGAIYGDDEDTPKVHEGLRNQITIEITPADAKAIDQATGARINPNKFESGDLFIFTGSTWVVITGEDQVIDDLNLWSWEGTSPDQSGLVRPVTRAGATTLEEKYYQASSDTTDSPMNQAIVDAPIGKVDGIDLSLKLKNPTLTDGDLVAYNRVQIGNLVIPKGYKIPSGVFLEDIIRRMITMVIHPSAATAPAASYTPSSNQTDLGVLCVGDTKAQPTFQISISKGTFDPLNYTDGANLISGGLPVASQVPRNASVTMGYSNNVTGGSGATVNGSASGNDWVAKTAAATLTYKNPGTVTLTATFTGSYSAPSLNAAAGGHPLDNTGAPDVLKAKSADEKDLGVQKSYWDASAANVFNKTITYTGTCVMPMFTNTTAAGMVAYNDNTNIAATSSTASANITNAGGGKGWTFNAAGTANKRNNTKLNAGNVNNAVFIVPSGSNEFYVPHYSTAPRLDNWTAAGGWGTLATSLYTITPVNIIIGGNTYKYDRIVMNTSNALNVKITLGKTLSNAPDA